MDPRARLWWVVSSAANGRGINTPQSCPAFPSGLPSSPRPAKKKPEASRSSALSCRREARTGSKAIPLKPRSARGASSLFAGKPVLESAPPVRRVHTALRCPCFDDKQPGNLVAGARLPPETHRICHVNRKTFRTSITEGSVERTLQGSSMRGSTSHIRHAIPKNRPCQTGQPPPPVFQISHERPRPRSSSAARNGRL